MGPYHFVLVAFIGIIHVKAKQFNLSAQQATQPLWAVQLWPNGFGVIHMNCDEATSCIFNIELLSQRDIHSDLVITFKYATRVRPVCFHPKLLALINPSEAPSTRSTKRNESFFRWIATNLQYANPPFNINWLIKSVPALTRGVRLISSVSVMRTNPLGFSGAADLPSPRVTGRAKDAGEASERNELRNSRVGAESSRWRRHVGLRGSSGLLC